MSDHFRSLFACKQDSACSFIFEKYKYRYDSYNFGDDYYSKICFSCILRTLNLN